jgi:hypothetical protein
MNEGGVIDSISGGDGGCSSTSPLDSLRNPWAEPPRLYTSSDTSSRKRRRMFYPCAYDTGSLSTCGENASEVSNKRVMRSAISEMSVREERKALQEIRTMDNPRPSDVLVCNGMSVAEFALRYTNGHHSKRLKKNQLKQDKKRNSPR